MLVAGDELPGVGKVLLRSISEQHDRPETSSPFEDWGDRDELARPRNLERWLIEVAPGTGTALAVGDMSAHPVWHGPTSGSMAMNIGISIVSEWRGRGIGTIAQRLLAELLHGRGIHRVEASTDVANTAEQHALERAGFVREGVLRGAQVRADGRHDLQLWSHTAAP